MRVRRLSPNARVFRTGISKPAAVVINPHSWMPRYWSGAWFAYKAGKSWSPTVIEAHCRGLTALYLHSDELFGPGSLDIALTELDDSRLLEILRTFHGTLSAQKFLSTTTQRYWDSARQFVRDTLKLLMTSPETTASCRFLEGAGRIKLKLKKRASMRALPSSTMHEVCQILDPESPLNPRLDSTVRLRNWLILQLLFRGGFRRGEMLLLRMDSLYSDVDSEGNAIWWITVQNLEEEDEFYEEDKRHSAPRIKNAEAFREVPADEELVALWHEYMIVRPEGDTAFLLTADGDHGLSKESLDILFRDVTALLTPNALKAFKRRTQKKHISCHDLRHTCATVAYGPFS